MRVAFVGTGDADLDRYPPGGGIEHQVWLLAHELARRGHEATILTRHRSAQVAPGLSLVQVPMHGRGQVLSKIPMSWRARKAIQALRPDVVYLSEKWVSIFPSRVDAPRIYATHNKDAFETYRATSYRDHVVNRVFFDVKRRIEEDEMARADVVAANSKGTMEYVRSRGLEHVDLLPMAVDVAAFREEEPASPPYVFASGQLLPVKGTHVLLDAFAAVAPDHPAWRLLIGGRGRARPALEAQARELGLGERVRFLGWLDRPAYVETLARSSIFVLPSFAETFGTVVLEAMASGKPVIASDIPGPRDAVEDGTTGALVPPGNSHALASALARMMSNASLRVAFGAKGRARVASAYGPSAAADAFERLALRAIERHRSRGSA